MIDKFENFKRKKDPASIVDHGRYQMKGNTYIPKIQETEFIQMTEDIKNVFNDILDLGSQYSVSYDERWYVTEVIITLDKSLFTDHDELGYSEWQVSTKKAKHENIKKDFKRIDEFCEDEIEYRLERIEELFGTKPHGSGEHLLLKKDGKFIIHKYPNWENVYVTRNENDEYSYNTEYRTGYEIHIFFGSVQKKLPYGVKASPLRNIDNNGRYIN